MARADVHPSAPNWTSFLIWALVGGLGIFGALSFIFPFLVVGLLSVAAALLVARGRASFKRSWFGLGTGVGSLLVFVAYVQRRGPGTVCWHRATASGCDSYSNPVPWLVTGVTLVLLSVIAFTRRLRTTS